MKIGIDARMYRSGVAGIGRYSQNFIKNLLEIDQKDEFILFMTKDDYQEFKKSKIQNPKSKQNSNVKIQITNIPHFSLAEQTKLPKIIEKENLDIMHFLNFNYPVRYRGKFIVTIHDLTLLFFPETAKETNFIKRSAFRYAMRKACENSEKIIAVSENTKKDIISAFKIEPAKIEVIYEAADDKILAKVSKAKIQQLKAQYSIGDLPVILSVGQFRPHKNLPGLIKAFGILRKEIKAKLVILGQNDPKHTRVYDAISETGLKDDIIMPGFVSNEDLAAWYHLASVFVFPSFYEGFGLPGLEAMAAGLPVAASNASSLPEIYQNAACYFDPFRPSDIADKIKEVLMNKKLRHKLIVRGREIASQYSWHKTAEETLKIYKRISNYSNKIPIIK